MSELLNSLVVKTYLLNGAKSLHEFSVFTQDFKGSIYSSQHIAPFTVASQLALKQNVDEPMRVSDLNIYSVGLNNYSIDSNPNHLINSNRRSLVSDLKRVSSFIESKLSDSSVIVLNRAHYDGFHYFLFGNIQPVITKGNDVLINYFYLDNEVSSDNLPDVCLDRKKPGKPLIVANSPNNGSVSFNSLSDVINLIYKNMRWKNIKF